MNPIVKKLCIVGVFTALMCILAPVSIPIEPVAITLATLMVYLIGACFSWKIAPWIIALYIALGSFGLPIFSKFQGGFQVVLGPTGGFIWGYLLGVIAESLLITLLKNKRWIYPVAMLLATVLIYAFGLTWFMIYMGGKYEFGHAMMVCVVPFLPGDAAKIVLASIIGYRLRQIFDRQKADE